MLEAVLVRIYLERISCDDEEGIVEIVVRGRAVDIRAAQTEQKPVEKLCHFRVTSTINACLN